MTDEKRAAALAIFDRRLAARRHALETNEKALTTFEVESRMVGDTRLIFGGKNSVETDFIRQLVEAIDDHRDVITLLEYEREVLFGAEEPTR